ncbi:hypothetical protein [Anaeroarcus burkinensis]|uniref:hypothetical protein n=1 Tax=Anaeroarcus burkinensis TaxID=82376 RepID=UPI00047F3E66|nr:hypothetical protein [Anaeroarcus burkinensis]
MESALSYTLIGSMTGVLSAFFLNLTKGILIDYKQTKLLAWAIDTELAEIEKQFSGELIERIRESKEKRAFTQFNYTEKYTGVFDSNMAKIGCFSYGDFCKLVSAYMKIKSYFDTLRTISSAFSTHLDMIKANREAENEIIDSAMEHYPMIEEEHNTMVVAIAEAYKVLGKYKEISFMNFLLKKVSGKL